MLRKIIKAVVPNRFLVAARFAVGPGLGQIPLVAVPSVAEVMQRFITVYGYGRALVDNAPVDASGSPTPWYTYPMIEYLDSLDLSDTRVFEYGCGNSTLWWAARAREVVSVEDNKEWHTKVSKEVTANAHLLLEQEHNRYVETIRSFGNFDLIIVDGIVRYQCCVEAVNHLNPGGAIVLDNADCLPKCTDFLRSAGLFEVGMNGFTPLVSRASRTSLFLSQPSSLRPQPHRPALAGTDDQWHKEEVESNEAVIGE